MRLVVIGAGGHAKVVIDAALAAGFDVVGALGHLGDADTILGLPVLRDAESVDADAFIVAVGDNATRTLEFERWSSSSLAPVSVIHPSATIAPTAELGLGTFVAASVVVNAEARIGANVILNTACTIDHDCNVGDGAHVGPGANVCGGVLIGEGALIGVGACIVPGGGVGPWAIVGAGAAVTGQVPEKSTWAGVPAKPLHGTEA